MDLELLRQNQFPIEGLSGCEGLIFGVGEGKAAVGVARAAHSSSSDVAGVEAEALQERLGFKGLELGAGDAGEDDVLIFREPDRTIAMALGQGGDVLEVFGAQAADGDMDAGVVQVLLFLRVDAVVGTGFGVEDGARIGGEGAEALFNHGPEVLQPHLVEVQAEAALGTLVPLAVVAPDLDDGLGDRADLIRLDPGVQGDGIGIHLGGEDAANPDAKPHLTVVLNGVEGDVVVEQEVVAGAGNGRVPFPRQVGELGVPLVVAGEEVLELLGVRPSVDNFQGIDAGDRVAGDVPRVVEG